MPMPLSVKIGGKENTSVLVGGFDITNAVAGIRFSADHSAIPQVELDVVTFPVEVDCEASIGLPESSVTALKALGWTPPA